MQYLWNIEYEKLFLRPVKHWKKLQLFAKVKRHLRESSFEMFGVLRGRDTVVIFSSYIFVIN